MALISRRTILRTAPIAAGSLATLSGRRAAAADPIKLGALIPLAGANAVYGKDIKIGMDAAIERINGAGGVLGRPLEMVYYDDGATPTRTATGFREMTGNGVNIVWFGPYTAQALAVMPLLEGANTLGMIIGTSGMNLNHEGFVKNAFFHRYNSYMMYGGQVLVMAKENPDVTKWALIIPDVGSGEDIYQSLKRGFAVHYPKVAGKQATLHEPIRVKIGTPEFRTQINQLMSLDAEGISSSVFGSEGMTFWQQAKQVGLDKKYKVQIETGLDIAVGKTLKANTPNNLWVFTGWYPPAETANKVSNDLLAEYNKRSTDNNPTYMVAYGHDSLTAVAGAIAQAGKTDTPAVVAALEKVQVQGAGGKVKYRAEDHQLVQDIRYLNYGPDAASPEGFKVFKTVVLSGDELMDPASPAQKWNW